MKIRGGHVGCYRGVTGSRIPSFDIVICCTYVLFIAGQEILSTHVRVLSRLIEHLYFGPYVASSLDNK